MPAESHGRRSGEHDESVVAPGAVGENIVASMADHAILKPLDTFVHRHLGPDPADIDAMLAAIDASSLDALTDSAIPADIRTQRPLAIGPARGERELLAEIRGIAERNRVFRSYIGMGYHDTTVPPVILRNVLENPGWYTQYTPYQAEIAQGRLEALLNFQTMVADLTGLPLANASLLDEGTAAAEALVMSRNLVRGNARTVFFADIDTHPQTIEVLRTRAEAFGVTLVVGDPATDLKADDTLIGALFSYPGSSGAIVDHSAAIAQVKDAGAIATVTTDLLALTLLRPPGEFGADIVIGSSQRFGVPMGFGGPHAAFMATHDAHVRKLPGRLIGVSKDANGRPALRLAIQTREQHIKRDRATSNICTAQVLLAIMAGMYAVYHGPEGLQRIARRVHALTRALAAGCAELGHAVMDAPYFDTITITLKGTTADAIHARARAAGMNFRVTGDAQTIALSLDEVTTAEDVAAILAVIGDGAAVTDVPTLAGDGEPQWGDGFLRRSGYLTHEVFNSHRSETEMLRYLTTLQSRDLSLAQSMIPLGSCTMKLNGTAEMIPVTWESFGRMHPFAPAEQAQGYHQLCTMLEEWLSDITGFHATSLQPNAGSQGELAGLMVIRAYHQARGDDARDLCIIPVSAHGTNPASAIAAGFRVATVKCDAHGNIDLDDLRAKASAHAHELGALMITYPSTHGVFETTIRDVCAIIHEHGGQVYLDGANMNAMVGLCRPGEIGGDVCHLNLHKTFCIPHGGGGPGMGPIACAEHLAPYLPSHPVAPPHSAGDHAIGAIASAAYGSASILPIPWMYIALMGSDGLREASQVAILNANYMMKRLEDHYDILYTGVGGRCAHEFIIDCRPFDRTAGIKIDDIAKRLMDFGFHAPTMSWPVPGTLMIEPTESESKAELDRFCDALIAIRAEIAAIEAGESDREDNPLRNAPHTIEMVSADEWSHAYSREQAAFPAPWLRRGKFWVPVARVDNPYGDRNLACTCPPIESYDQA